MPRLCAIDPGWTRAAGVPSRRILADKAAGDSLQIPGGLATHTLAFREGHVPEQRAAIREAIATWSATLLDCFDGLITLSDVTG